jgi:hypothetical protein
MGATFHENGLPRTDPEAVGSAVQADARTRLGNRMGDVDTEGSVLKAVLDPAGQRDTP